MMSCPIGDGAACVIVGRPELARRKHPGRPVVKVLASHLGSEKYARGHLFVGPVVGPAQMTVDGAKAVYEESGLGPEDLDLVQVHDAFAIEELAAAYEQRMTLLVMTAVLIAGMIGAVVLAKRKVE